MSFCFRSVGGVASGGRAGGRHRRPDPAVLRLRRGAGVAVPGWGLRRRLALAARAPLRRRPPRRQPRGRRLQEARAEHRLVSLSGLYLCENCVIN